MSTTRTASRTRPGALARPAYGLLICGIFLVAVGLALGAATNIVGTTDGTNGHLIAAVISASVTGLGCTFIVCYRVQALGRPRWLRLGPAFGVYYTLVFSVFALAWLRPQGNREFVQIDERFVPPAIAIASIGLVAWTIGYLAGAPRVVRRGLSRVFDRFFPPDSRSFRFPNVPTVVYGIGLAARLVRLSQHRFGYLQDPGAALSSPTSLNQFLALLEGFADIGLVLAVVDAVLVTRSTRSKVVAALMFASEVLIGFVSASKESVLLTFAAVVITVVFVKGRLPRRATLIAVFLTLIVFPITKAYRTTIRTPQTQAVGVGSAAKGFTDTLRDSTKALTPRSLFIDSPAQIAARLRETDNVALILQKTPSQIRYEPWKNLIIGPAVEWIPRALWPSKPILSTAVEFSQEYYLLPVGIYSGSAVTIPGDLARHGGYIPVIVGMLVLGCMMYTFDVTADPTRDWRRLALYVPLFSLLLKSESDATVLVIQAVQTTIFALVAARFAFARKATRPSARAAT